MALLPSLPNAACRHDEPDISVATSHIHTSAGADMIAVQLASKRGIAKTRSFATAAANPEYRVSSQSWTSQLFRALTHPPAPPRSPFDSDRNAASAKRYNGNKSNSAPSFKYPSIQCYRSSSRYQVTPHRTSCPCLVSFSVGHYDVLVSTPDSMFSVV